MDLFDYMREQNMEKEVRLHPDFTADNIGRSSGTTAYYRKRQIALQGDQGGQIKLSHFLWSSGNWEDHACQSNCQHDQCRNLPRSMQRLRVKKIWKK